LFSSSVQLQIFFKIQTMKTLRLPLLALMATLFIVASCQKNSKEELQTLSSKETINVPNSEQQTLSARQVAPSGACNSNAYIVTLESHNIVNGNWEWIWSVQNSNPGNGSNGTVQDLSHWGMQFGSCFNWNSVVSAAFSGDGITWITFIPSYQIDPSQSCMTTQVLKFDFGTTGNTKSYYKLIVNQNFAVGNITAYYKSGRNTGCCIFSFNGIGCLEGDGNIR
jgi:hypothetical protein